MREIAIQSQNLSDLPPEVQATLADLLPRLLSALPGITTIALFGSAAEGRMRRASDVNLIVVADDFKQGFEKVHGELSLAHAAQVRIMFVSSRELQGAAELFAVKFQDIKRRHRLLFGTDPFKDLTLKQDAIRFRLRQTLLNLILRQRGLFAMNGNKADRMTRVIAELAGPLRGIAAAFLSLQGKDLNPREALVAVAASMNAGAAVEQISVAREKLGLDLKTAVHTHTQLVDLCEALLAKVESL
ncbi:MAG: nucleotidyltransferase domain-containing protein [Leptospirales bacterium]|nr:nucleotidyltransferase domain-containing protein [Leptospirales bacterium]